MIDDLITKGTNEPYRMFTSRAEYRLILREDNADERLTPSARKLGLIDDKRWSVFESKYEKVYSEILRLNSIWVQPGNESVEKVLGKSLSHEYSLGSLLKRPGMNYESIKEIEDGKPYLDEKVLAEQVENQIKYEGYIRRQKEEINKYRANEELKIPGGIDYESIKALSSEVRQKLSEYKPETIGQASRLQGVTPASISILLVYIKSSRCNKIKKEKA